MESRMQRPYEKQSRPENTSSTNEAVNTAYDVTTASSQGQAYSSTYDDDVMFSFFAIRSNSPQLDNEDLEQIDIDDLEEMDLKWKVAMLAIRVKRFLKKTGRNLNFNRKETVGFDKTKVECYNCHKRGHFARECRAPRNKGNRNGDAPRRNAPVDTSTTNALVVQDGICGYDWSFQAEEGITNFALMAYTSQGSSSSSSLDSTYDVQVKDISIKDLKNQLEEALKEKDDLKLKLENFEESSKYLTKLINSQISAKDKTGLGYDSQINENEVVHSVFNSRESDVDNSPVNDRFKIGEGFHVVPPPYTGNYMPSRPNLSFVGLDDYVYKTKVSKTETSISKTSKDIVKKPKTVRPSAPIIEDWDTDSDNDSMFIPKSDQTKPKFTKINFVKSDENVKSVNKETTHRQVEYLRKSQSPKGNRRNLNGMMTRKLGNEKPVLNNKGRVTGQREIRPVWNNAQRVNHQNKLSHPHPKRNFVPTVVLTKSGQVPVNAVKQSSPRVAASISTTKTINTAAPKSKVNDALRKTYSYFKAHSPDQGIFDNGCSRYMTGNKSFLTYYQEIDGGFVAFRGSPKGGKITGKGKIRTGKLDFEDVYFVKELKFNLFSVSQMCDKKNSVLFTKNKCLVLSPDFKLLDESQIFLKVPKQNNMYSFDLKNVVPLGGLTCLFAKAIIDESNLWHRRLGHINFKTINKLVRGNLVRGLPLKLFENDHTCVACQKESNTKPLGVYPDWLFDIDLLTNSMNYEPVNAGNQTKKNASIEDNVDVVPTQRYILLPLLYDSPQSSEDAFANDAEELYANSTSTKDSTISLSIGGGDLNNLETTMNVSLIPTTRIRKDHPKDQIIGDINSATQTRRMTKITEEHAMYTQEEGIDYDEVFAPVARIEAIRLFLAYASFMGFIVYQMDVKSTFLYGTIEEEVYVCQPPCFEDPQYSKKVYKVEKALYGLHQALGAWYETLSTYLLENGFRRGTIDKTLFIKKDKDDAQEIPDEFYKGAHFLFREQVKQKDDGIFISQDKIEEAEDVDVHFMQVTELDHLFSHLHVVKSIFRYLKGQSKLGLWYPRDSPFDLEAFSDSDYAGASLDRKSQQKVVNFLAKGVVDPKSTKKSDIVV
ncbi:putative ribonuclease H-like domain-containing protein [Tanacetum coccineum]